MGICRLGHFIALEAQGQYVFLPLKMGTLWQTGQVYEAVVRRLQVGAHGGGGFCEDLNGNAYFLRRCQNMHEGQGIRIEVVGEPRAPKPALARETNQELKPLNLANTLQCLGFNGAIEVKDLELLARARAAFPNDHFALADGFEEDVQGIAEDYLENNVIERVDVRLIFETSQMAHLIDVDGQGTVDAINAQAVPLIITTIVNKNLGGLIVIDFLPPQTKADRRTLVEGVQSGLSRWPQRLKIHAMNESGHLLIERQRLGPEFLPAAFS